MTDLLEYVVHQLLQVAELGRREGRLGYKILASTLEQALEEAGVQRVGMHGREIDLEKFGADCFKFFVLIIRPPLPDCYKPLLATNLFGDIRRHKRCEAIEFAKKHASNTHL